MPSQTDERPPVAIGHVRINVNSLDPSCDLLQELGLREITRREGFAVMELRGGTHLIVSRTDEAIAPDTPAPIDLMVDDVHATRADYEARGFDPSEITSGSVHSSFTIPFPDGYRLKITSSHAGDRAV